jgi:hypothetical protein
MIGGEQHDSRTIDGRRQSALNRGDSVGYLFQTAQAPGRFGQFELSSTSFLDKRTIHGLDGFKQLIQA